MVVYGGQCTRTMKMFDKFIHQGGTTMLLGQTLEKADLLQIGQISFVGWMGISSSIGETSSSG